jgi:hypothetical protein
VKAGKPSQGAEGLTLTSKTNSKGQAGRRANGHGEDAKLIGLEEGMDGLK